MKDRFLFKAKRIDNGEWVVGNLITNVFFRLGQSIPYILCHDKADYDCFEDFSEENGIFEVQPCTICQCIGKRDKYNHLIFENDLMDGFIYPYLSGLDSEHDYFAEVCWCDDITGFGICTHKYKNSDVRGSADGDVNLFEDFDSSKWEVIGNIFDNPELLER